jgi:hypothetical protein
LLLSFQQQQQQQPQSQTQSQSQSQTQTQTQTQTETQTQTQTQTQPLPSTTAPIAMRSDTTSQLRQQKSVGTDDSRISTHSVSSKNISVVRTLSTSLSEPGFQTKRKRKKEDNESELTKKVKPIHSYFHPKNELN